MSDALAKIQIVELEVTWWGVCIGGRHYTGYIRFYDEKGFNKVDVERKLGRKEAKQYAEEEGRMWLPYETKTNKFETRENLEHRAIRWCEENFKSGWILLDGDIHNPSKAIGTNALDENKVIKMNDLAATWLKVPNAKREGALWDETYQKWDNLTADIIKASIKK